MVKKEKGTNWILFHDRNKISYLRVYHNKNKTEIKYLKKNVYNFYF